MTGPLRVLIAPAPQPGLAQAVDRAGATPVEDHRGADVLLWTGSAEQFDEDLLGSGIRWVQLPSAGVEQWQKIIERWPAVVWSSAAGAYSAQVAEHAVALLLACSHNLASQARHDGWHRLEYRPLRGSRLTLLGAGGVGQAVIELLRPFGLQVTAVNRTGVPVAGASRTLALADWPSWAETDHLVASLPSTHVTDGAVGVEQLGRLHSESVVVNVGRGSALDQDAALASVSEGRIGWLGLDVTQPEPLPVGHPLWRSPRVLITSHSANPRAVRFASLADRVQANLELFQAGRSPQSVVGAATGY